MATTTKKTTTRTKTEKGNTPVRLSKIGKWMREHPDGILKIIDHRAVLK